MSIKTITTAVASQPAVPNLNMNDPSIVHLTNHVSHWMGKSEFPGWCSKEKASRMMALIIQTQPKVCVEIGVLGGSSAYPTLMALLYNKARGHQGVLHGIDPWSNAEAVRNYDSKDKNAKYWKNVPFAKIHAQFVANLKKHGLSDLCVVHKETAEKAASKFKGASIDILHIDGNHSEKSSVSDVLTYLPKVREGGYVWLNDSNRPSRKAAFAILLEKCDLVYQDQQGSYALLKKKSSVQEIKREVVVVVPTPAPAPAPASPAPQPVEVKEPVVVPAVAPVSTFPTIAEEAPVAVEEPVVVPAAAPVSTSPTIVEEAPVEVKEPVVVPVAAPVSTSQITAEEVPVEGSGDVIIRSKL